MKLLRPLSILLVVGAIAAPVALSRSHAATKRVACGIKQFDVYFWPNGHPAVPSLGFPAFAPPHLELYLKGSLADASERAYVDANTSGFAKSCATRPDAAAKWGGGAVAKQTATARIRCSFPWKVELQATAAQPAPAQQLLVTREHTSKAYLSVFMTATGSYANLDKRYCKATPIPGVP